MLLHPSGKHTVDYEGFCFLEKPTLIQGYYFGNIDNAFEMEFTSEDEKLSPNALIPTELFGNISKTYLAKVHQFFDFTIECNDEDTVKAHKFILAAQSKFFQAFFSHEDKNIMSLSFRKEPTQSCIDFLYTGRIELDEENVQYILEVANFLEVVPLCNLCAQFLAIRLDEENIKELSNLGSMIGCDILRQSSIQYLLNNPKHLSDDRIIHSLPKEVLKETLKSNQLILFSPNGNIVPGIKREIMVAEIISKYLRVNNVVGKFEYFLDCLKIWNKENFSEVIDSPEYDGPFEELELVYTSFEAFQAVISRHLQVRKFQKKLKFSDINRRVRIS